MKIFPSIFYFFWVTENTVKTKWPSLAHWAYHENVSKMFLYILTEIYMDTKFFIALVHCVTWINLLWFFWDINSLNSHLSTNTSYASFYIYTSDKNVQPPISHLFHYNTALHDFSSFPLTTVYLICLFASCLERGFILMDHKLKRAFT